jgi:inner membrane protein
MAPLMMIWNLLGERRARRDAALTELASAWGGPQTVAGPVLVVPYRVREKVWPTQTDNRVTPASTEVVRTHQAVFLPDVLDVKSDLKPEVRKRGIYEAVVYAGTVGMKGSFARPDFAALKIPEADVLWDEAWVALAVSDLRGARGSLELEWAGTKQPFTPGTRLDGFSDGVHARLASAPTGDGPIPFSTELTFNGSGGLRFAPLGRQSTFTLASTWPDPSFQGAFLPTGREVNAEGFTASWSMSYYGRSIPQQWTTREGRGLFPAQEITASLFGVDLIRAVDSYRHVERTLKYGLLFIVLAFTAFFLFEVLGRARVHPLQYTLVGAALVLFYLALLSLSEFAPFGTAYLAGASAAIALVTLYSIRVLQSLARAVALGAGLTGVYGYLYITLQQQDYALLYGTAGLFAVLAAVMFATRNIDWYARDAKP